MEDVRAKKKKVGPWQYVSYPFSPNVLVAVRKLKWFDLERLREIKKMLRGCKFFWEQPKKGEHKSQRQTVYVEVYSKFDENMGRKEMIAAFAKLLESKEHLFSSVNVNCPDML